jgi:hypothetical protein
MLCLLVAGLLQAAPDMPVRQPVLDSEGRFWVYRNGLVHPPMPFLPYAWMSDVTNNMSKLISIDLECVDHPNEMPATTRASETQCCLRTKITWGDATWASIAFISGPDKPPWWGENNRGRHYDLSGLAKKKLVFFTRGEHGGEAIKVQIGVLGGKPYGDSLPQPFISDEMTLTQEWVRHEIDLKSIPGSELEHICNGFGVIVERSSQSGSPDETVFYLDDIYYE